MESYPGLHRFSLGHKVFTKYFITSFLFLIFEIGLVYLLYTYGGVTISWSSILGVTADLIFTHFFSKCVFNPTYDRRGFSLYLETSILGMTLNIWVLTWSLVHFRSSLGKEVAFWLGKILATGILLFLKYSTRKCYLFLKRRRTR